MLIAGFSSLFAVSLLFFGLLVSGQSGFASSGGGGGEGRAATRGPDPGKADIPASIDAARRGIGTSPR